MASDNPLDDAYRLPTGPYPGLRPFLNHESQLLMGRERQVAQIIERLERTQFVAVIGGSGSGKSSLIRAGVVPELWGGGIAKAGTYWVPVICTPGTASGGNGSDVSGRTSGTRRGDPSTAITRLAWKLGRVLSPCASEDAAASRRAEIADVFRQPGGFSRLVELYSRDLPASGPDTGEARFLFVIDQFEELFDPSNKPPSRVGDEAGEEGGFGAGDEAGDQARAQARDRAVEEGDQPGPNAGRAEAVDAGPGRWQDAERMVESVIDHYFNPHPRCHVVLTMRSERLSDCASHLMLPEAINTSMYLVRRLGPVEIEDAIVGPAKYYLRLLQRNEEDDQDDGEDAGKEATRQNGQEPAAGTESGTGARRKLPADVVFDQAVIDRLQADVESIKDDPDHLPLLQHVLARTWESSCRAEGITSDRVPARITWEHFVDAVAPLPHADSPPRSEGWFLPARVNALRSSLERWAQRTYEERAAEDRLLIDRLLRRLAYKDPDNGLYFQQRVGVNDPGLIEGHADPEPLLRSLLSPGFLKSVNYLFWDAEDPRQVSLKVSHEAFIRGWPHFRSLVDRDAERLEEFVSLLKRCSNWIEHGRSPGLLLAATEIERLKGCGLTQAFWGQAESENWYRMVLRSRGGAKLSAGREAAAEYVAQSLERIEAAKAFELQQAEAKLAAERLATEASYRYEKERADRALLESENLVLQAQAQQARAVAQRRRWGWLAGLAGLVTFVIGSSVGAFGSLVYRPAMTEIAMYLDARLMTEYRQVSVNNPKALPDELETLLDAATKVEEAKDLFSDQSGSRNWLRWFEPLRNVERSVEKSTSEPYINAVLRKLLTSRVWPSKPGAASTAEVSPGPQPFECNEKGLYGVRIPLQAPRPDIVVRTRTSQDGTIDFFEGGTDAGRDCGSDLRLFWAVPGVLEPILLAASDLSRIAVATRGRGEPSVAFYNIEWVLRGGPTLSAYVGDPLSVAPGDMWVRLVGEASDPRRRLRVLQVVPRAAGSSVLTAGHAYRIFSDAAVEVERTAAGNWSEPLKPGDGAGCATLERRLPGHAPGTSAAKSSRPTSLAATQVLQFGNLCVDIQRGAPPASAAPVPPRFAALPGAARTPGVDWVVANIYRLPVDSVAAAAVDQAPAAMASVNIGWLPRAAAEWRIGRQDTPHDGWIAVRQPDGRMLAAPWSTAALIRLGREVLEPTQAFFAGYASSHPDEGRPQGSSGPPR